MVQNLEHVVIIPDLGLPCRIVLVRGLARNLVPHLGEVHVDAWVVFDHLLELAQHRDKFLLPMFVDVVNCATEPLTMDTVVSGQPSPGSEDAR
jgi:hypothetical protein